LNINSIYFLSKATHVIGGKIRMTAGKGMSIGGGGETQGTLRLNPRKVFHYTGK
jgi:hypothetical protein